ncbi:hypothetical protein GW17_00016208 [Ensete ventricosum]|nr:hypothetical protein GW17_00016208 [Ensete ventricosum]
MPKLIQLLEEKCTLKQVDEPLQQTTMGEDYLVRGYEGCFLSIKEFHMTIFRMLNKNTVDTTSQQSRATALCQSEGGILPCQSLQPTPSDTSRVLPCPILRCPAAPSSATARPKAATSRNTRCHHPLLLFPNQQPNAAICTDRSRHRLIRIKRPPLLFPRLISTEYIGKRRSPLPLALCGSRPLLSGRASVEADLRGGSSDSSRLSALGDDKNMFAPPAAAATATTAPFHLRR